MAARRRKCIQKQPGSTSLAGVEKSMLPASDWEPLTRRRPVWSSMRVPPMQTSRPRQVRTTKHRQKSSGMIPLSRPFASARRNRARVDRVGEPPGNQRNLWRSNCRNIFGRKFGSTRCRAMVIPVDRSKHSRFCTFKCARGNRTFIGCFRSPIGV